MKEADVCSYYDCDATVRMARRKCEAEQTTEASAKQNIIVDSSLYQRPGETTSTVKNTHAAENANKISFETSNSTKESPSAIQERYVPRKIKDFKIRSHESGKESQHNPLLAVNGKSYEETAQLLLKWPDIKNILDLVSVCKHINFFQGMRRMAFFLWYSATHAIIISRTSN